ncbi:glucose-6-phosphate isomerase [Sinorhizobium sp. NFACC03]|uniref:glucose-6-phosphate isomerase n=1 Tax=Sinorhizobium sp. NFACC03 TaxID=1566295 RepID=UPI0008925741|nr:glucose-6-phosphate isomerase [Sinorhizobium sp. NFACC03]SDA61782.1 glucose-6-phosphate isomerase [Sinorhizobium sp. NFACC03]
MTDMLPSLHEFNLNNGLSSTREPIRRTLSKMKGMFHDQAAYEAQLAKGDALLYEFYDMGVPDSEKDVAYGTSITYPGKVGDEYHMTKGHFHTVIDTAEVYYCLRGHGYMMMETPEGKTEWLEFLPGKAVYVPGRWAHRSINVHPTEPLVTFFAFPGNAGHDYGTIESKGFRKLMVERDGKPTVIDNPRWNG